MADIVAMRRPRRANTLTYRIYCELVCSMRVCVKKKEAIRRVCEHFGVERRIVKDVYDRFIRKSLAAGFLVKDLR